MDFPRTPATPLFITSNCLSYTPALDLSGVVSASNSSGITWVANLAVYIPFVLPFQYTIRRLCWINGTTASANVDVGVYTPGGGRIVSAGATAQSGAGASAVQYVTPTAVTLMPGRYYMALACSGTTSALFGTATYTAANLRAAGVLQQALGSAVLPATWTVATVANALYPWFGFTRTSTGF